MILPDSLSIDLTQYKNVRTNTTSTETYENASVIDIYERHNICYTKIPVEMNARE